MYQLNKYKTVFLFARKIFYIENIFNKSNTAYQCSKNAYQSPA